MNEIIDYLDELIPNARCELEYNKDYELLIAVMLSAQTTDKRVNEVTKVLFKKYPNLKLLSEADINDIISIVKPLGITKKAYNVINIAKALENIGYVPNEREFLESLPGVGRKTASVVLGLLFNEPSFAVDTHVFRVSNRLCITKDSDDVISTEVKLKKYFEKEKWNRINSQMVLFGRYVCKSKNPSCESCNLKSICKYYKSH